VFRQAPNNVDRETYEQLKSSPPTAAAHPHTFAWFCLVARFNDSVRNTWVAAPAPAAKAEKKQAVVAPKVEEPKKEVKPAEEDEMDLFGDDDENDEVSLILNRVA